MNREKHQHLILYCTGILFYYILFQSFYNVVADKSLLPYADLHDFVVSTVRNFIPILVTILLTWVIVFRIYHNAIIWRKMVVDGGLCIVLLLLINLVYWFLFPVAPIDWAGTAFNAIFVFLGVETIYYVHNFRRTLSEAEHQRELALQYKYDALKAQVNPHFLFNSLNLLNSLVSIDRQKSKDFILALSKIYRYTLTYNGCSTVPLTVELDFLHDYVKVLSMRYHNQFEVEIIGEENVRDEEIVPYTLQLLMENVTKHNVISNRNHMHVLVVIGDSCISMSNPIKYRQTDTASRIGLNYIKSFTHCMAKSLSWRTMV